MIEIVLKYVFQSGLEITNKNHAQPKYFLDEHWQTNNIILVAHTILVVPHLTECQNQPKSANFMLSNVISNRLTNNCLLFNKKTVKRALSSLVFVRLTTQKTNICFLTRELQKMILNGYKVEIRLKNPSY